MVVILAVIIWYVTKNKADQLKNIDTTDESFEENQAAMGEEAEKEKGEEEKKTEK